MNHEQANSVKELAPRVNKVLERLDVECPACGGIGSFRTDDTINCPKCKGKGKLHYTYTPQVGEWFIYRENIYLINEKTIVQWEGKTLLEFCANDDIYNYRRALDEITPILEWEEIRNILKRAGYHINVTSGMSGGRITIYPIIGTEKIYEKTYYSGDLQIGVMKAVIELGRGMR